MENCSSCGQSFKMVFCSSCGQSFKMVYCSSCGKSFNIMVYCSSCGQSFKMVYCSSCGQSFKLVYCSSCGKSFKMVYCSSCGQSFKMASWSHVANQSKSHFVVSHSKWHLVHHDDKIFQNGHSFATCILPSKGFLPWHNYLKLRFFPGVEFFSILYIIGERLRNKQIWCISIEEG